jgi:putative ABC transport system substrate-binding protein
MPSTAKRWRAESQTVVYRIQTVVSKKAGGRILGQYLNPFKAAAATMAVEAISAPVQQLSQLEPVAADQAREPNGALIVMADVFLWLHRAEVISLAAHYGLPDRSVTSLK